MWKIIENLCTPAKVYLALAILATIFGFFAKIRVFALFAKLMFAFLYAYFLNFLCKKGYKNMSWFLVVLPYLVMMFVMVDIFQSIKK